MQKRDVGAIPGSGRSPGGGDENPAQYSCLENPMDRGAWRAMAHEVAKGGHDSATEHASEGQGFPVAQLGTNLPAMWETGLDPWVGKIPRRRDGLPTPAFLGFSGGSAGKESTGP